MHRRRFLAQTGSGLTFAALSACGRPTQVTGQAANAAASLPDVDDEAASSMFEEMSELGGLSVPAVSAELVLDARGEVYVSPDENWTAPALTPELEQQVRSAPRYWGLPDAGRPAPGWPADDHAPDYHHLAEYPAPADPNFQLTAATLAFLAERNSFVFTDQRPVRIFGLRGCKLESNAEETSWAPSHYLQLTKPDHLGCQCVMGVWRPSDGQIRLFRASTTPAVSNMWKALRSPVRGAGTSLLPTGLYRYRAGPHKRRFPESVQSGALLIEGEYVVLRSPDDLTFDPFQTAEVWTRGAAHNIHSAGVWSAGPDVYDSAGCQVVRGSYTADRTRCVGPWAHFRESAGLVDAQGAPIAEEAWGQGTYQYLLLTGLEAALHAAGDAAFRVEYRYIRPGSRGSVVAAHKERVSAFSAAPLAGDRFDMATSFATLRSQKQSMSEPVAPIVKVRQGA